MKRRHFVRSALLTGASLPLKDAIMDNSRGKQQWYELRTYSFVSDAQRELTSAYLRGALLPALNRAGCSPVGVFFESQPVAATGADIPAPASGAPRAFLLIPFDTIDAFAALEEKLVRDKTYGQAGESYLAAPARAPAYQRIESSLLKAFAHMPAMEVPEKKARLFELRCYESPTESAGQKKIEMFNDAGEIDIFKRVGARPVFFGQTLIGERRPNLTYMLCFDDMAAHDACWKAFGNDARWKQLKAMDEYSDARLISKITHTFLTPAAFSQV